MVYYKSDELMIRNMEEEDGPVFVEEFTAQGWHPDQAVYRRRLEDQAEGKCIALTAVCQGHPAGSVYVYLTAKEGPFKGKGWPIIVDFNVLKKFQRKGIGSKLMDIAEQIAGQYADTVWASDCAANTAAHSECMSNADIFRTERASGIRTSNAFSM